MLSTTLLLLLLTPSTPLQLRTTILDKPLPRLSSTTPSTLREFINGNNEKTLIIFSTYPSDFNAIEYTQRLNHYLPELREAGVNKIATIMSGTTEQITKHRTLLGSTSTIDGIDEEAFADPTGSLGKIFGVSRGWQPGK